MRLPPLNAIKSIEAAARCGSHVAAARELGVTLARGGIARDSAASFLAWLADLAPPALRDA